VRIAANASTPTWTRAAEIRSTSRTATSAAARSCSASRWMPTASWRPWRPAVTTTEGSRPGYRPISCDRYSVFELAILQRRRLRLLWRENNVFYRLAVPPLDLETRAGEEFLHCRLPSGEHARLRLDYILRADPV